MTWVLWVPVCYLLVGFVQACLVLANTPPEDMKEFGTEASAFGAIMVTWFAIDVLWFFLEYMPHHRSTLPS